MATDLSLLPRKGKLRDAAKVERHVRGTDPENSTAKCGVDLTSSLQVLLPPQLTPRKHTCALAKGARFVLAIASKLPYAQQVTFGFSTAMPPQHYHFVAPSSHHHFTL
jgi:hypothetical protein